MTKTAAANCWGECERLTVCQTTRSAHPGRGVGFLPKHSYLKPRSLLCALGQGRGGPGQLLCYKEWSLHTNTTDYINNATDKVSQFEQWPKTGLKIGLPDSNRKPYREKQYFKINARRHIVLEKKYTKMFTFGFVLWIFKSVLQKTIVLQ